MLCFSLGENQFGDVGRTALIRSSARRSTSLITDLDIDDAVQELKAKNAALSWICLDRLFRSSLPERCHFRVLQMILVDAFDKEIDDEEEEDDYQEEEEEEEEEDDDDDDDEGEEEQDDD